ncbi:MAG: TrkH family potassium uptake protein [Lachnospiraceae bacterium]|nr:TrkH family potassium uptake protein [Lachnospiraceae bacterium]
MNYGVVIYILGRILQAEGAFLIFPIIVGIIYGENDIWAYLITMGICGLAGTLLSLRRPNKGGLFLKEGFFVVGLGWILMSAFGAIPFVISGDIPNYIDALFETASGLSTTGASILTDVEALSRTNLFWRSFTHLLGGMGVFVFLSALLPMLGGNSMNLMKAESTGPSVDKLVPRLKDTAKILYAIYLSMGLVEAVTLIVLGMPVYDSLLLTFGTIGTGGFGVLNTSISTYSPAVQWTITVFMFLSGVNYAMYFLILRRKFKSALKLSEVRLYFCVYIICVALICFDLRNVYTSFSENIRLSAFQVSTLLTSTGYMTADFDKWPEFSKTLLILIMLMGACAGSTGGGIKMSRVMIIFKSIKKQLQMLIHPRAIKKIKVDGSVVDHDVVRSTNAYIAVFCLFLVISTVLLSFDGHDFTTNFTATLATLNNMGPGFNLVGPTCNYSFFSPFSKIVLIIDMLAGRLELFPILLLMTPGSWKRKL